MKSSSGIRAKREAVQPSLWDRLVNDLPGIASEIDHLQAALEAELGAERVEELLAGDIRRIESDGELSKEQKQRLQRLLFQLKVRAETENQRVVVSGRVLREAVRRDIEALFNTERFECMPMLSDAEDEFASESVLDLSDYPEVRRSVVNYGVPSFSGRLAREFDPEKLAAEIKSVLATFEPRLRNSATKVTVTPGEKNEGLNVELDAVLIMTPTPERMKLRTKINLDNGAAHTDATEV